MGDRDLRVARARLRPDELEVWTDGYIAWQVKSRATTLLGYDSTSRAFDHAMRRRAMVLAPVWLVTVVITIAALALRRRRMRGEAASLNIREKGRL